MSTSNFENGLLWGVEYTDTTCYRYNWDCIFDNREAAVELFEEQIEWYKSQGAVITREVETEEDEDGVVNILYENASLAYKEGEEPFAIIHIVNKYLNCADRPLWVL